MNAKRLGATAVTVAACVFVVASTAWACGDKLVALGGGVGFDRVMLSRNPGHIVMVLEADTGLAAANEKFNLAGSLSLAGHEVFVAKSVAELRSQKFPVAPDLILVDAERARQVQFQPVAGGSGPVIMPVTYSHDSGELAATEPQTGCVTVAAGRKGAQLLKAIENALKLRSRGLPLPCEKNASQQA